MPFGVVRDPADRQRASPALGDRAPDRFADFHGLGRSSGHRNLLLEHLHPPPAVRGAVAERVGGVDLQFHEVGPVPPGVRESPGHVAVAAGDHRRNARQGESPQAQVADVQFGAVPDVGDPERQVHVARHQRRPARRPPGGHRPGIAPGDRRRFARKDEVIPRDAGEGRRTGDLGDRKRPALQRGVPAGPRRIQERREFGWQRRLERRGPRLVGPLRVVQDEIHRHHRQQGVADPPGRRIRSEEQVFERRLRESGEAGGDPVPVRLEGLPRLGGKRLGGPFGPGPHPVKTRLPVHPGGRPSHETGQFARGLPPLQVHLEEPSPARGGTRASAGRRASFPPGCAGCPAGPAPPPPGPRAPGASRRRSAPAGCRAAGPGRRGRTPASRAARRPGHPRRRARGGGVWSWVPACGGYSPGAHAYPRQALPNSAPCPRAPAAGVRSPGARPDRERPRAREGPLDGSGQPEPRGLVRERGLGIARRERGGGAPDRLAARGARGRPPPDEHRYRDPAGLRQPGRVLGPADGGEPDLGGPHPPAGAVRRAVPGGRRHEPPVLRGCRVGAGRSGGGALALRPDRRRGHRLGTDPRRRAGAPSRPAWGSPRSTRAIRSSIPTWRRRRSACGWTFAPRPATAPPTSSWCPPRPGTCGTPTTSVSTSPARRRFRCRSGSPSAPACRPCSIRVPRWSG